MAQNLGLSNIYKPASELTEVLRAGSMDGTGALVTAVREQYGATLVALNEALG